MARSDKDEGVEDSSVKAVRYSIFETRQGVMRNLDTEAVRLKMVLKV